MVYFDYVFDGIKQNKKLHNLNGSMDLPDPVPININSVYSAVMPVTRLVSKTG